MTAPGTGLGMSIVKQIVDLSGGRIDVRSDQFTGTEVKLSLPMENCVPDSSGATPTAATLEDEDPVDAVRRRAVGRSINMQGFVAPPRSSELHVGALASLRKSMVKYCTQWFRLVMLPSSEDTDISIMDEAAFLNLPLTESRNRLLIVLCDNSARKELYPTTTNSGRIVEFVSKPCGPHRLAKALLNCLDMQDAAPKMLPLRVSTASNTHSAGISFEDTTAAALSAISSTSSVRLIGDLQSAIGFSPAIISLIKTPGLMTKAETDAARPVPHRRTSDKSSGSTISNKAKVVDTDGIFPMSTSLPMPDNIARSIRSEPPDDTVKPLRGPKMLIVEVSARRVSTITTRILTVSRTIPSI